MVKVSVIVPVYNNEEYLDKCLSSLIGQSLEDIEIICVNDGSGDSSLDILNKYKQKDNRIVVFLFIDSLSIAVRAENRQACQSQ
jgi:glycosyltransferase involved in cell wall biosynthesis